MSIVAHTPFKDENSCPTGLFQMKSTVKQPLKGLTVHKSNAPLSIYKANKGSPSKISPKKTNRKALGDITNKTVNKKFSPEQKAHAAKSKLVVVVEQKAHTAVVPVVDEELDADFDPLDMLYTPSPEEEDVYDFVKRKAKEGLSSLYHPSNDPDLEFCHLPRSPCVSPHMVPPGDFFADADYQDLLTTFEDFDV